MSSLSLHVLTVKSLWCWVGQGVLVSLLHTSVGKLHMPDWIQQ